MTLGTLSGFDVDADDFVLEGARLGRRDRLLVAGQREAVEIILGETVLLRDHLRTHELAPLDAGVLLLEAGRFVVTQPFLHVEHRGRPHRHAAHAFHAGGNDHVLRSAHDGLRGELDRLLRRTALAIDGDRGHAFAQMLAGEYCIAPDLHRLLAALTDTAHDDVVDRLGFQPAAFHHRIERCRGEIDRVYSGKAATAAAAGSADGFDDIGFGHRHPHYRFLNRTVCVSPPYVNVKRSARLCFPDVSNGAADAQFPPSRRCDLRTTPSASNLPKCNKSFAFGASLKAHASFHWREWICFSSIDDCGCHIPPRGSLEIRPQGSVDQ